MTTIRTLAATEAARHGIDETAAKGALIAYAQQLADLDDWADKSVSLDTEVRDEDAEFLTGALAAGLDTGDTGADAVLDDLAEKVSAVVGAEMALAGAVSERDAAIRAAVNAGAKTAEIATVAGISVQRIYQIRDGRR